MDINDRDSFRSLQPLGIFVLEILASRVTQRQLEVVALTDRYRRTRLAIVLSTRYRCPRIGRQAPF